MLAHTIDANGYMLQPVMVEDGTQDGATYTDGNTIIVTRCPDGYYKPQWDGSQWVDANPPTQSQVVDALKSQKIAELRTGYMKTLAGGFNETVSGTVYTFGWTTSDESNLDAVRAAVSSGFLTFPVQYADVHGTPVSIPDQTTLDNIEHTASNFMAAQHQQVLTLIGNAQAVSNTDPNAETTLNGITWTPATYTQV